MGLSVDKRLKLVNATFISSHAHPIEVTAATALSELERSRADEMSNET